MSNASDNSTDHPNTSEREYRNNSAVASEAKAKPGTNDYRAVQALVYLTAYHRNDPNLIRAQDIVLSKNLDRPLAAIKAIALLAAEYEDQ